MKNQKTMTISKHNSALRQLAVITAGLAAGAALLNSFAQQSDNPKTGASNRGSMGMMHSMMQMQNTNDAPAMAQCMNVCRATIYPDSPASLLALKDQLGLSEEQTKKLADIESKTRTEAKSVLTADQRKTFEGLTRDWKAEPMMQQMEKMMPQMQHMMGGQMQMMPAGQPKASADQKVYTCPMHPEVVQDHPGSCPKCGMQLVEKK